jgi:hypothetical protein
MRLEEGEGGRGRGVISPHSCSPCRVLPPDQPIDIPLSVFVSVIRTRLTNRADEAHQGRVTLDYNQFVSTLLAFIRYVHAGEER